MIWVITGIQSWREKATKSVSRVNKRRAVTSKTRLFDKKFENFDGENVFFLKFS